MSRDEIRLKNTSKCLSLKGQFTGDLNKLRLGNVRIADRRVETMCRLKHKSRQPRSQGVSSSLVPWDVKRRDPGNEVSFVYRTKDHLKVPRYGLSKKRLR